MFTGIVREVGNVASFDDGTAPRPYVGRGGRRRLVSIDGVCLTVVDGDEGQLAFDVVPETLRRAKPFAMEVNVEPALRAGEPLGGHYVQGHVDAVGQVRSVDRSGDEVRVVVEAEAEVLRYCVEKGSVTVDGVSLTIAELDEDAFAVALVPHTLEVTTLSRLEPGELRQPRGRRPRQVRGAAPALRGFARRWGYDPHVSVDLEPTTSPFAAIDEAIEDIRSGKFVVVVDDADRENEGDLTIAAQFVTPEAIAFMATYGRGLICLCLTAERCDELGLRPMTERNETPHGTAFTVSIEAREGVSTGISAHDRARTIQVAIDPGSTPNDLVQPGHVFPLRAQAGRGAPARRTDGGGRRPRAARRPQSRGRRVRDHERRRDDGPACRTSSRSARGTS